jgi:hypothetical protein
MPLWSTITTSNYLKTAGQGSSEPVAPRIYLFVFVNVLCMVSYKNLTFIVISYLAFVFQYSVSIVKLEEGYFCRKGKMES